MDLGHAATAFAVIFPVELPDKTFIATLVLATRYRPLLVWIGVGLAFGAQCAVAVTAGGLLARLPGALVAAAAAVLFLVGALVLWRGAAGADAAEVETEREFAARATREVSGWRQVAASFGVLFVAEWGDLSQLFTAGLAARLDDPVGVFAGSWAALLCVAGLAAVLGRTLLRHVSLGAIRRVGAAVCLVLAGLSAYELVADLS